MSSFLEAVEEARQEIEGEKRRQVQDESEAIRKLWNEIRRWWEDKVGQSKKDAIWQIEQQGVQNERLILLSPVIASHLGDKSYSLEIPIEEARNFQKVSWHVHDSDQIVFEAAEQPSEVEQGLANVQALFYAFSVVMSEEDEVDSGFGGF